jgi:hypothetical protein
MLPGVRPPILIGNGPTPFLPHSRSCRRRERSKASRVFSKLHGWRAYAP